MLHQVMQQVFKLTLLVNILNELTQTFASEPTIKTDVYRYPDDFIFGASTAAYQIEGAWNEDGKGESIWDHYLHKYPNFTIDESNGDVACDSYHKFEEDIRLLKDVGFNAYRFSIAWTRILPNGNPHEVNQLGLAYYRRILDSLIANRIEPIVTLYHWDLPQKLQTLGGWLNPKIVDYFEEYARVVFRELGDQVKWWITINEPREVTLGYGSQQYVPAMNLVSKGQYIVGHNLLRAHARAFRMYQREFKTSQKGKLSLSLNGEFCRPASNAIADVLASERYNQFNFGWFAHPIFSRHGDYPQIMKDIIYNNSRREGNARSRLPEFTNKEKESLKGAADFYAMNFYSGRLCTENVNPSDIPSFVYDMNVTVLYDKTWPRAESHWLFDDPIGFGKMLNWVRKEYRNPPVLITENGWSEANNGPDMGRIHYYWGYLRELLRVMNEDGCNVIGHTAWSLLDNFEWREGYTQHFGLYTVDLSSPNRTRAPKMSVKFFQELIRTRTVNISGEFFKELLSARSHPILPSYFSQFFIS